MTLDEAIENSKQKINSFMTKDEFITMLQNLRFDSVDTARIYFITGFDYDAENDTLQKRGFNIEIE